MEEQKEEGFMDSGLGFMRDCERIQYDKSVRREWVHHAVWVLGQTCQSKDRCTLQSALKYSFLEVVFDLSALCFAGNLNNVILLIT